MRLGFIASESLGKRHNSHPRASVLPWIVIDHKWCLLDKKNILMYLHYTDADSRITFASAITGMVSVHPLKFTSA
jgi:hypothetical protein